MGFSFQQNEVSVKMSPYYTNGSVDNILYKEKSFSRGRERRNKASIIM